MTEEIPPYRHHRGIAAVAAKIPAVFYNLGLGLLLQRRLLLLTTTGRKSGRPRTTPLAYGRIDDTAYLLSEAGTHADWYRNLAKDPNAQVQIGNRRFLATAERVTDGQTIAHVLRLANQVSPRAAQRYYGIPPRATDEELLALAPQRLVVALRQKAP